MTALEALCWTLPPSLAAVSCFRLLMFEWRDRRLSGDELARIAKLEDAQDATAAVITRLQDKQDAHAAELRRQAEQVSLLADRYR